MEQVKTNCFTVYRVANGWLVKMPHQISEQENLYAGLMPAIKEVMRLQDEDPLLSGLREEEEERPPERLPVIGRDESLYICKNFQEVLELLLTKFGNLKAYGG